MSFGMGSGGTSARLSYFDDKSNLQHKQENPNKAYNNGKCKNCSCKAKKQKGFGLFKKIFFRKPQ